MGLETNFIAITDEQSSSAEITKVLSVKYHLFTIKNYRGIEGPVTINFRRHSLLPIIGVNECGKTTILHALLAFDHFNDKSYSGRHLDDTLNLYRTNPADPVVSAEIELSRESLKSLVTELSENYTDDPKFPAIDRYSSSQLRYSGSITIARNIKSKIYTIEGIPAFSDKTTNHHLARKIISRLPYILYFDDFQDSVPDEIEIPEHEEDSSYWLNICETLFQATSSDFSVYALKDKEDRQRKSILSKVKRRLNATLTKEWSNFRLDEADALEISVDYEERQVGQEKRRYLKFDIIETDAVGDSHYFYIRNRSKGFYWFFNFVMKLEFNPKAIGSGGIDSIYVLDEPGSYLHGLAQERLCKKLKMLSDKNYVVYCTHSHHLLNPKVIPLNSIQIADKSRLGNVSIHPIYEHTGTIKGERAAYQPLIDALQLRPLALDLAEEPVIITEGIVDRYLLELFKGKFKFSLMPSVGAESEIYLISILIAWRAEYRALWDNDAKGKKAHKDALNHFGAHEAEGKFFLLPLQLGQSGKCIIQNLVDGDDIHFVKKKLRIPSNVSFDKVITVLFFLELRESIIKELPGRTKSKFESLYLTLNLEL